MTFPSAPHPDTTGPTFGQATPRSGTLRQAEYYADHIRRRSRGDIAIG
jgi:hypothetical protein